MTRPTRATQGGQVGEAEAQMHQRVKKGDDVTDSEQQDDTFNFVIVGAGSAGCVLAAQLTEDPDCTVLLLGAGGPNG